MAPGPLLADPVNAISLGMGLMFGTAGLPHILMRFFTVIGREGGPQVRALRLGVRRLLLQRHLPDGALGDPHRRPGPRLLRGRLVGGKLIGGGNMVAMHLAKAVGGNFLLGFLAAVAFATILAVVSGLALAGASAISHDLYARVIKKGKATEEAEIKVSKMATIGLGIVAIGLGILFEKQNVAFMVGLAFGIAAAANFPVLILSMYWKGLTTRGALVGGYGGLVSAVLFVLFSKSVWVNVLGNAKALFPYDQPALFAMPLAFGVDDPRLEARRVRRAPAPRRRRSRTSTSARRRASAPPAPRSTSGRGGHAAWERVRLPASTLRATAGTRPRASGSPGARVPVEDRCNRGAEPATSSRTAAPAPAP